MEVIYSIGLRFRGGGRDGGTGNLAFNEIKGILRHGFLKKLIVATEESGEIDRELVKTIVFPKLINKALYLLNFSDVQRALVADVLFDRMAARHIERCDIFHGWSNFSLKSLKNAKALGAITVLERPASHTIIQNSILDEEYRRFLKRNYIDESVKRIMERSLEEMSFADYMVVPSRFVADGMEKNGIDEKRIVIIPSGVDTERFKPARKTDDVFRVLFMGQLCLRKGVQYLLEAWDALKLPKSELVLVGMVSADVKGVMKRYGSNPTIKYLNYTNDYVKLYHTASVFVFPSLEEGSALVNYEAMACGLPVITTHNSGPVARDGIDGFIIPARDPKAIGEKITELYENLEKRLAMGASARKHVEQFTWERCAESLISAYKRIAPGKTGQIDRV